MRKIKKYTITFKKRYQSIGWGEWLEVSDSSIYEVLKALSEIYGFEIVKMKLKDCFGESFIKIKCNRSDKDKIFFDFCKKLGGEIENIKF